MTTFSLTVLGINAAIPTNGHFLSGQILNINENLSLIDCGEGTQIQLDRFRVKRSRIGQIFITHLHGDHIFGLPGVLTSFALQGRTKTLKLYGPKGLKTWIETTLNCSYSHLPYPLEITEISTDEVNLIHETKSFTVKSFPLVHRIPCCGFLFEEKVKARKIIAEKIMTYNIPVEWIRKIKFEEMDFITPEGKVIPNGDLTLPPAPQRSFAYCSDTMYTESIIPYINNVNLLYHEATFTEDNESNCEATMHSTAKQAATIAKLASAEQLLIGHFSSRYRDYSVLLDEAKTVFSNTILANEGLTIEVGS